MRFSVRREDRRNLAVGFVGLLAITAAHSVMETARDTLFLTSLPATHLPRAYLAIAVLAIVELKVHERILRRVRDRRMLLAASLVFGSLVTLGFWALLEDLGAWAPFGFYVWTGLLITVVLIQFWLLLDDAVTVTQAKRIFPAIAAGGVAGATLGSLLAEGLMRVAPPIELVVAAAVILGLAGMTPFLWKVSGDPAIDEAVPELGGSSRWLLRDSYLSRVLALVLIGTIALTIVDFIFKSAVADQIPPSALGPFFARFYLGLNTVALLVQAVGVGWLLRVFGTHRSSALLPLLIFGGAAGLALGPVLPFAVALKAVDGSLRHTLYRSSVEVLYLPLDSTLRERAKGIIEVFGHRGGQAAASLLIMLAVGVGLSTQQLATALLLLVAAWVTAIMSTRHQYVDQFRARLRHGVIDAQLELEELDHDSLDVLLDALNSDQDAEVLAAIDVFDRHARADLIPVLVLYHPSAEVRNRALDAFAEAADRRFVPIARRMLSDHDPAIRATGFHALDRLQASDPALVLDEAILDEQLRTSLLQIIQLLQWHAAIASNGSSETPDAELLRVALCNKERATLERAVRLMGIRHPEENFTLVWRGLTSDDVRLQAASHEVLEAALSGPYREAVLTIVDQGEPPARRARIAAAALGMTLRQISYEEAVEQIRQDLGHPLSC
ncbi:MAG: Npt1/Npt2 family nucleotide transporter [Polyangiales bacterium]